MDPTTPADARPDRDGPGPGLRVTLFDQTHTGKSDRLGPNCDGPPQSHVTG